MAENVYSIRLTCVTVEVIFQNVKTYDDVRMPLLSALVEPSDGVLCSVLNGANACYSRPVVVARILANQLHENMSLLKTQRDAPPTSDDGLPCRPAARQQYSCTASRQHTLSAWSTIVYTHTPKNADMLRCTSVSICAFGRDAMTALSPAWSQVMTTLSNANTTQLHSRL